jgi:hypothetical protein
MRCLRSFGTRRSGRHLGLGSHGCGTTTMQFIYLCSSRAPEEFPDCILPPIESFPHLKNLAFAKAAKHKGARGGGEILRGVHGCFRCDTYFVRANRMRWIPRAQRADPNAVRGRQQIDAVPRSGLAPWASLSRLTSCSVEHQPSGTFSEALSGRNWPLAQDNLASRAHPGNGTTS